VTGWCEHYSSCQYVLAGDLNVNLDDCNDKVAQAVNSLVMNLSLSRADTLMPSTSRCTYVNPALNHEN